MAATAASTAAAATGKAERERDAAAAEVKAAEAAAAEMEERVEARFGEAPAEEVEDPEVTRGRKRAIMRICPPCSFGTGETRVLS